MIKQIKHLTANILSMLDISFDFSGKSPVIVYDTADLDSAVESVVDAIWFNQGQVCSAGSKLLVQSTVYEKFVGKSLLLF